MNQGVEILLARMDSNPDEFVSWDGYVVGKWDWIMRDVQKRALGNRVDLEDGVVRVPFLSDEEVKALWNKVESLRADQFTKKVMRTLLEEEEEVNPLADAMLGGFGAAPIKAEGAAIKYDKDTMTIKTKGRYK